MLSFNRLFTLAVFCSSSFAHTLRDVQGSAIQPNSPCPTILKPTPPMGLICGKRGSVKRPAPLYPDTPTDSAEACQALCLNDAGCQTFSYNDATSACGRSKRTIIGSGFKEDANSPTRFWNRRCFKTNCPQCPTNSGLCGTATCKDFNTDPNNCGGCGTVCGIGYTCTAGSCTLIDPFSCNNAGVGYAIFPNTAGGQDETYSSWDPTTQKSQQPVYQNSLGYIGNLNTYRDAYVYSSGIRSGSAYDINYEGFIYAPETGDYTLTVPKEYSLDDIINFWHGDLARAGWTRSNSKIEVFWATQFPDGTLVDHSYTWSMDANTYMPFRLIYAQAGGPGQIYVKVTGPSGQVIMDQDSAPHVIQFPCDGTGVQPLPQYGQET